MKGLAAIFAVFFLLGNVYAQEGKSAAPVDDSAAKTVLANVDSTDYDRLFTKVDKEPEFPGGIKAWIKFLETNLDPTAANRDNLEPGHYRVYVYFIVDKFGVVSHIKVIDKISKCPTCVAEAEKLMKKSPKWIPAVVNGHNVKCIAKQAITYTALSE